MSRLKFSVPARIFISEPHPIISGQNRSKLLKIAQICSIISEPHPIISEPQVRIWCPGGNTVKSDLVSVAYVL